MAFSKGADNRPKLEGWTRKVVKEVDVVLATMVAMGESGRLECDTLVVDALVKASRKHRLLLEAQAACLRGEEVR